MIFIISEDTEIVLNGHRYLLESGDRLFVEEDTIDMHPTASKIVDYLIKAYRAIDDGNNEEAINVIKVIFAKIPENFKYDIRKIYTLIKHGHDKAIIMDTFDKFYQKWNNLHNKKR